MERWTLRAGTFALQIEMGRAQLRPGAGVHEFALRVEHWADSLGESDRIIALLTGTVRVGVGILLIGALQPALLDVRSTRVGTTLRIPLTDDQVTAVTWSGQTGDVELLIDLEIAFLNALPDVPPLLRDQVQFRLPATEWTRLLDELGTSLAVTVRVPAPLAAENADTQKTPSLTRATGQLRYGRQRLRDHDWKNAAAASRAALEVLKDLIALPTEAALNSVPPSQRNADQRWAALFYAAQSLSHGANHETGTAGEIQWNRVDADALLTTVAALISRYAD